ncbi:hypothetical protein BDV93DRAFT_608723 [Ceratobasidium sp. AG-I]|nr:hypothetical protein BDV93DRAFT_608723 [Ceratobasidium sp. AG-I]
MRVIQPTARSSPPATRRSLEPQNNLATGRNVVQAQWDTCSTISACLPGTGAVAMVNLAPPSQSTHLIPPHLVGNSTVSTTASSLIRDTESLSSNDVYALPGQVNLATGSNAGNNFESTQAQYGYPAEFSPQYDQSFYQQYAGMTPTNPSEGAEIPTTSGMSSGFAYAYAPSPNQLTNGGAVLQQEQVPNYDTFQQALSGPLLATQALDELNLDGSQGDPVQLESPLRDDYSLSNVYLNYEVPQQGQQHVQHPFINFSALIGYTDGRPVDEQDAWSSVAFSSPSVASYNSSPHSTMHDGSVVGTMPALHFDNLYSRHSEPPLNRRPSPLQNISSNSSPGPETLFPAPLKRERRGAISQQGGFTSTDRAKHPMLGDSIANHLDANNLEQDERDFSDDDSSTPSLSPSTLPEPDFPPSATGSLTATRGRDVANSDVRISSLDRPALKLGEHHSAPALASMSSPSSAGPSGRRYHPYPRTTRMTAHEQVIQFDNGSAADLSDERETSRRTGKKSRGSKRIYCNYICPVKNEQCGKSISREADMGRHLSRHKATEDEMVTGGLLDPERATQFGELKPVGAAACAGCGTAMSRKDALKRHLRKAGKACQSYYPDIVL